MTTKFRLAASTFGRTALQNSSKARHGFLSNVRYLSSAVLTLSDFEATEKFTQLNHKSVVYCTASWCPPCKVVSPIYDELSAKYTNIAFGKVDVDDNSDTALEFNVTSVPTFVFFDGEDIVERFSGADPNMLEKTLQDLDGR